MCLVLALVSSDYYVTWNQTALIVWNLVLCVWKLPDHTVTVLFLDALARDFGWFQTISLPPHVWLSHFQDCPRVEKNQKKNILPVLNMTVLNNILLFTLFLLVSYFIANHFNVCFIKKKKKIVMNMCSKLQIFYWDIIVNFLIMHKGCMIMFNQIDSEYLCWTWAALTRHAVMYSWTSSPSSLQSDIDKSRNNH